MRQARERLVAVAEPLIDAQRKLILIHGWFEA